MSKTNRAVVVYGNDTHLNIQMHKFDKTSGEYIDFDLTQVTDLNVFLICSKHATEIHLDYTINSQFTNIITCDIDYRLLHPNASYGIVVEGYDGQDHFRYEALPSEGFLVISNTSGLKITDEVNTIDLSARTGWGISVDGADLTNYYTKDEVDALLENIDLEDYYDKTETDNLLDDKQDTLVSGTNIKSINNQSILGAGNITIEGAQQIQSDWNQTNTTKADYIKNKPDLSAYAQKSDLNNYYTKTQADGLLNTKVDDSELDNYYDKTETDTMLNQKANTTDLNNYQETLVSGTNIKTINNESILGSGNITIQGSSGQVQANWEETDTTDPSYIQNKPDLSVYATQTDLALKQDTLVSGQNIKTVNNQSLLGSGNIKIQAGDNHDSADEATANALYELNERTMFTNTMLDQLSDSIDASMQQMENDVDSALAQSEAKVNASLSEADDEFQSAAFALNTLNTAKQDTLVSGTNIKTINNESVLGAGNLTITQVQADWSETGTSSPSYIQNKPTIPVLPNNYEIDYSKTYLTFEAIQDTTFTFTRHSLQYSLDNGSTWTSLSSNTATPTINAGNKIIWKQISLTPDVNYGLGTFSATGNFKVYGNIMSLYYGDNFVGQTSLAGKDYAYTKLFYNNTYLTDAENLILPATTLANSCYTSMFYGCASLTNAPLILPATTLASSCYYEMFYNCTSLITTPELPAKTLANYCYGYMFRGCTSITSAPELPATTLTQYCYQNMFYGCSKLSFIKCLATNKNATNCLQGWVTNVKATGTFIKAYSITSWTTGTAGIPSGWTVYAQAEYEYARHYELPSTTGMVTGYIAGVSTNNLKIDVVATLPASPDSNTIYIVQ